MVSAWVLELGISLGQLATEEKSNEITTIPELIDSIDVKGADVTIDAAGCQKNIVKKIVDAGGDLGRKTSRRTTRSIWQLIWASSFRRKRNIENCRDLVSSIPRHRAG